MGVFNVGFPSGDNWEEQGVPFPTEGKKYGGPKITSHFWVTKGINCVGQKAPNIVRQKADDQMIL